jgi:hypothetical protein
MMAKTRGNFAKLVGDHLATIAMLPTDGVGSQSDEKNYTHFTFHELVGVELSDNIISIEKI